MRVLIVKMSSLGDVIHTLPAVTELARANPGVEIDWLVEEGFTDIPRLHPSVSRVIPIAIRRWRKNWFKHLSEVLAFRRQLRETTYDVVIDAQGLVKSALVTRLARGEKVGLDAASSKEPVTNRFYQRSYEVQRELHAIQRTRFLFAQAFQYSANGAPDYGLEATKLLASDQISDQSTGSIMFLHGTTWDSKHWPEEYWLALAKICTQAGYPVLLPYLGEDEKQRAMRLAAEVEGATLLPPGSLDSMATQMARCAGVVSVDTGLGHLATALNLPLVGIFGSTDPDKTGFLGPRQTVLASDNLACIPCLKRTCQYKPGELWSSIYPPCYENVDPQRVWQQLRSRLEPIPE